MSFTNRKVCLPDKMISLLCRQPMHS